MFQRIVIISRLICDIKHIKLIITDIVDSFRIDQVCFGGNIQNIFLYERNKRQIYRQVYAAL